MFKKSLIATAVVAAAFGANATTTGFATLDDGGAGAGTAQATITVAQEVANAAGTLNVGDIVVNAEAPASASASPVYTVSLSGATVYQDTSACKLAVVNEADGDLDQTVALTGQVSSTAYFILSEVSGSTITVVSSGDIEAGDGFVLTGLCAASTNLAEDPDGDPEVTVYASGSISGGIAHDPAATTLGVIDTVALVEAGQQFAATFGAATDKLDETIDVGTLRYTFESNGNTDSLNITMANTGAGVTADVDDAVFTVNGNFSIFTAVDAQGNEVLDANGFRTVTGVAIDANGAAAGTGTDAVYLDADDNLVIDLTTYTNGEDIAIDFTTPAVSEMVVIPNQEFTVTGVIDFSDTDAATFVTSSKVEGSITVLSDADAGEWDLNGANIHVPFMPFDSAKYSQSVTVANSDTQDGDVSLVWYIDGTVVEDTNVTTAGKSAITDISAAVRTSAAAQGITGNAAFDIIVNADSTLVEATAVYYDKADGDRVNVNAADK